MGLALGLNLEKEMPGSIASLAYLLEIEAALRVVSQGRVVNPGLLNSTVPSVFLDAS
jgi:hypothetical protein